MYPPRDYHLRKGLIDRQFQVRIRLVIFEIDVVARLMFFSKRCFKYQGLDFIVCNNELDISDLSQEGVGLTVEGPRLEVRTDAAAQVFRLADIDRLTRAVFVEIDAG